MSQAKLRRSRPGDKGTFDSYLDKGSQDSGPRVSVAAKHTLPFRPRCTTRDDGTYGYSIPVSDFSALFEDLRTLAAMPVNLDTATERVPYRDANGDLLCISLAPKV